jgi:hypothetical protein
MRAKEASARKPTTWRSWVRSDSSAFMMGPVAKKAEATKAEEVLAIP